MDILIAGSGSREEALAWKLRQSPHVGKISNTSRSVDEIVEELTENPVDLVVVGQDQYLADGLTDAVMQLGIPIFGPTKAAAEIEWSKAFAKKFMQEEGIPTAAYVTFTDSDSARAYVQEHKLPIVIKASGLARGKGVVIAETYQEADAALAHIQPGEIVIEEFMQGLEISVHALSDGNIHAMFPSSKDHKRIFDGDRGPMTGGMGTVAPVPSVTQEQMREIEDKIVIPILAGLKKRGRTFVGTLFPGVMLTADGPKVIEVNARFGQPECESYMRLIDTDLADTLMKCATGNLAEAQIRWKPGTAATIVLAARGYPESSETGIEISGLADATRGDIVIFNAGTVMHDGKLYTDGGRVLAVTATGDDLKTALAKTYSAVEKITFEGMQYRRDIGKSVT